MWAANHRLFLFRRDEMKFYGNGIVWNAQANRPLCRFEKGEITTEDESIITVLTDLRYKHDEIEQIEVTRIGDIEPKFIDGAIIVYSKPEDVEKPVEKTKSKKPTKHKKAVRK